MTMTSSASQSISWDSAGGSPFAASVLGNLPNSAGISEPELRVSVR